MTNILIVEDDDHIADFIARGMRGEGWSTTRAKSGEIALSMLQDSGFDAVLLDIMLPGMSGHEVCAQVRHRDATVPILMLTALSGTEDKIAGLDKGADDYLPKPFDFDELVARVRALLRRANAMVHVHEASNMGDPVRVDKDGFCLVVNGVETPLSVKEMDLATLFLSNPGRALSRERILNSVWGLNEDPLTNIVDVYVRRLRMKLGDYANRVSSVRGVGYRYD